MTPVPLIIDTDPGIDDLLAILLALHKPDQCSLEAITLTFGNTTLDYCRANVLRTFNVLHKHIAEDPSEQSRARLSRVLSNDAAHILLSQGATGPLGGERFTASYFHGRDGVSGISSLPGDPWGVPEKVPAPLRETEKPAHDVILDVLRKHPPGTVRIAAVGPLTNIAMAWQKDPETFLRVGGVSVMGCALDVPGNTTPCAEFNTYADPFAARVLLHDAPTHPLLNGKRLPIDILPLDLTTRHTVPFARLCNDDGNDAGIYRRFISVILANPRKATNGYAPTDQPFDPSKHDLFQAHDPLAVAHAIYCPSPVERKQDGIAFIDDSYKGWHMRTRTFGVETEGALTRGFCVVDRRGFANTVKGADRAQENKDRKKEIEQAKAKANGTANGDQSRPTCGEWDVVVDSPGNDWFADVFCQALSV